MSVARTDYGWLFDGPGTDAALIFYPGARVEETAYAPLLRRLAEKGTDVCLLRAPLHLAFFDMDRAESVRREYDYARCYVGGHSLGGACAAICASRHPGDFAGVVLLAAYPTKTLDGDMTELTLYGTEDGVLDRARLEEGRRYAPDTTASSAATARRRLLPKNNGRRPRTSSPRSSTGRPKRRKKRTARFLFRKRAVRSFPYQPM